MTNKIIISFIGLALFAVAVPAMASYVGGTLTTGISTEFSGIVDGAPVASPLPGGKYTSVQSVTLTATSSDSIYYTLDGTEPSCTPSKGTKYTGAITLSSSKTIHAVACFGTSSPVGSHVEIFAYGINVPTPSSGGGGSYTPSTTPIVGDINGDGVVNIKDFNILLVQWGQTGSSLSADLNHNGVVGIGDFTLLMANWTK